MPVVQKPLQFASVIYNKLEKGGWGEGLLSETLSRVVVFIKFSVYIFCYYC